MAVDRLAMPMFLLTLLFVGLIAGLIVAWFDIPRLSELHAVAQPDVGGSVDTAGIAVSGKGTSNAMGFAVFCSVTLLLLWPLYIAEFVYLYGSRIRGWFKRETRFPASQLAACVIPPLRLGLVNVHRDNQLWLPHFGWRRPGRQLIRDIESVISKPMLIIAFLILPILLLEYAFDGFLVKYRWLLILLHACTGFIWWCFACEFIVMVGASKRKFQYVKKNWLDLAIILLPLISFVRSIRVLRLARFAKVQQVTKITRMYRMRGLFYKALRGLLLMSFIRKILRISPEKTLENLKRQRNTKEQEITDINQRIQQLEVEIAANAPEFDELSTKSNN